MKASCHGIAILGFLALALAGCDSFSIRKQFTLPDDAPAALALAVTKPSVPMGGSVGLSASGGTPPYDFAVAGDNLAPLTASNPVGSATATAFSSGTAIGKVRITVTDAVENTAFAYVTVLPPTPDITLAKRLGDGSTLQLEWSFTDSSLIDKFRLDCSEHGQAYSFLKDFETSTASYQPNDLITTETYSYRLYAVSGSYVSEAATTSDLLPLP